MPHLLSKQGNRLFDPAFHAENTSEIPISTTTWHAEKFKAYDQAISGANRPTAGGSARSRAQSTCSEWSILKVRPVLFWKVISGPWKRLPPPATAVTATGTTRPWPCLSSSASSWASSLFSWFSRYSYCPTLKSDAKHQPAGRRHASAWNPGGNGGISRSPRQPVRRRRQAPERISERPTISL